MSALAKNPQEPPAPTIPGDETLAPSLQEQDKNEKGLEKTDEVNAEDPEKGAASKEPAYNQADLLTGKRLAAVWSAFMLSVLLIALDNTIVSTALPKLASQFNALNDLTWIVSAYLLTQAGFILIFGQLLTVLPTKWVYLAVIFIFEIGSLICGVAPNMNVLILGRAIAGTGASGIYTSISTVVSYATRLEQRPVLFGTIGAVFSFASVVGPLVGGAFTDSAATWRWCFYINLPLGALSIAAIALLLPARAVTPNPLHEGKTTAQKWLALDWLGGFLSLAMITMLLLPLQWGGNTKQWNDPVVIALLATFGALLILFILVEWWMGDYAIVPLKFFKNLSLTGTCITIFFIFFSFMLGAIYFPFLYQAKGQSAVQSGISVIPFSIATVVGTMGSGTIIRLTGRYKPFLIGGPWLAAIAGGLLYTVDTSTSYAKLIGYQIILGVGCGSSFQNTLIAIQAEYAPEPVLIPQASALVSFSQLVGGTLGISIGGTVFSNQLNQNLGPYAAALGPERVQAVRQSVIVVFSLSEELRVPVVESYVKSVSQMFLTITPALFLAGFSALFIKGWNLKKREGGMQAEKAE